MLRFIAAAVLAVCICTVSFAGATVFTKISKKTLAGGEVQITAEGTNKLECGEEFDGWTPEFINPDGKALPATIVEYTEPPPAGGAKAFVIRYLVKDPNGKDKGNWKARSKFEWTVGCTPDSSSKDSDTVAVP